MGAEERGRGVECSSLLQATAAFEDEAEEAAEPTGTEPLSGRVLALRTRGEEEDRGLKVCSGPAPFAAAELPPLPLADEATLSPVVAAPLALRPPLVVEVLLLT